MYVFKSLKFIVTGPLALKVRIMTTTESSSIVVRWDAVDDSLITGYTLTWFSSARDLVDRRTGQTSYTINGLTLNTIYTIIISTYVQNDCGTGPRFTTSIILSASTTSTTSSITPTVTPSITSTVTASTNPVTIMSTVYPTIINPSTASTISIISSTTSTILTITTSIGTVINTAETTTTAINIPIITISTDTVFFSTSPAKTTMADKNGELTELSIFIMNVRT